MAGKKKKREIESIAGEKIRLPLQGTLPKRKEKEKAVEVDR